MGKCGKKIRVILRFRDKRYYGRGGSGGKCSDGEENRGYCRRWDYGCEINGDKRFRNEGRENYWEWLKKKRIGENEGMIKYREDNREDSGGINGEELRIVKIWKNWWGIVFDSWGWYRILRRERRKDELKRKMNKRK